MPKSKFVLLQDGLEFHVERRVGTIADNKRATGFDSFHETKISAHRTALGELDLIIQRLNLYKRNHEIKIRELERDNKLLSKLKKKVKRGKR